jgi:hypothetical protein
MWVGYGDPNGGTEIYCLGVRGEQYGKVFYAAGSPMPQLPFEWCCVPVADSFAAFLGMLTDYRNRKPNS